MKLFLYLCKVCLILTLTSHFVWFVFVQTAAADTTGISIKLSQIPGITIYSSEDKAKTGAHDSGDSFNNWIAKQNPSAENPLTVEWDGWIYVAKTLQYTPKVGGYISYVISDGLPNAGAFFGITTTAQTRMENGTTVNKIEQIVNSDILFKGLTFNFNAYEGTIQPHDDSTYGIATGFTAAGVRNLTFQSVTLLNPRTYTFHGIALDGFVSENTVIDDGPHPLTAEGGDHAGFQFEGPDQYISIVGGTIYSNDDALAFNASEPLFEDYPLEWLHNYYSKSFLRGWTGGVIRHVRVKDVTLNDAWFGIRVLAMQPGSLVDDMIVDGVHGTTKGTAITMESFSTTDTLKWKKNNIGNIEFRNCDFRASPTLFSVSPARIGVENTKGERLALINCKTQPDDSIPYIIYTLSNQIKTLDLGSTEQQPVFQDNFIRSDTPVGQVGNGWIDSDQAWQIKNNQLQMAKNISAGSVLQRSATEEIQDGYSSMDIHYLHPGNQYALRFRQNNGSGFQVLYNPAGGGIALMKTDGQVLSSVGANSEIGHTYRLLVSYQGPLVMAELEDVGGSEPVPASSLLAMNSSQLSGSGTGAVWAISPTGVADGINSIKLQRYVSQTSPSSIMLDITDTSTNFISFGATLDPSSAETSVGIWSATAGIIDQFGRLHGLLPNQSTVVSYTVNGRTGKMSYPPTEESNQSKFPIATVAVAAILLVGSSILIGGGLGGGGLGGGGGMDVSGELEGVEEL